MIDLSYKESCIEVLIGNQLAIENPWGKDISEKIIRKTYGSFIGFDLVSVQPVIKPKDTILLYNNKLKEISVQFERLRCLPQFNDKYSNDVKDMIIEIIAAEIKMSLERSITNDLRNNACISLNFEIDQAHSAVEETFKHLIIGDCDDVDPAFQKIIVTGPDMASLLGVVNGPTYFLDIECCTSISLPNYKIYVDPLFPLNQALCIVRGEGINSGFVYSPYIPFLATNVNGEIGISTRHGKHLSNNKYFGTFKLNWEN